MCTPAFGPPLVVIGVTRARKQTFAMVTQRLAMAALHTVVIVRAVTVCAVGVTGLTDGRLLPLEETLWTVSYALVLMQEIILLTVWGRGRETETGRRRGEERRERDGEGERDIERRER